MSTARPTDTAGPKARRKPPESREDRLKAALKANMARRKAQAKARAAAQTGRTAKSDQDKG